jgi:hypothetical protein
LEQLIQSATVKERCREFAKRFPRDPFHTTCDCLEEFAARQAS